MNLGTNPFHMNIEGKSLYGAILDAGERLLNFHGADNGRGATGTGTLDWKAVRDVLPRIVIQRTLGGDRVISPSPSRGPCGCTPPGFTPPAVAPIL